MSESPEYRRAREHSEHLAVSSERAQEQSRELRERIASLARSVAGTEEGLARALDASAALRPHAAERLGRAAREARDFAARERDEADAMHP